MLNITSCHVFIMATCHSETWQKISGYWLHCCWKPTSHSRTRVHSDGVEFICFDLPLAGILPAVARPELSALTCDECLHWNGLTGCTSITISGGPADFNRVYSRSDNQQCIDGMPQFVNTGNDLQFLYDSEEGTRFVSSFADDSRSDFARCTTDTRSRGYQKLAECIQGMWEYKHTVDTGDLIAQDMRW